MKKQKTKNLKLIFPLWRGGNNKLYSLGSLILNLLCGEDKKFKEKIVKIKKESISNESNNNLLINNQEKILQDLKIAKNIIESFKPDKLLTIGGDCLISQQPINYFNKCSDDFCVIWFDAHPDISNYELYKNSHAMVLSNLFGDNSLIFSSLVDKLLKPNQVIYFGLNQENANEFEKEKLNKLQIKNLEFSEIKNKRFLKFDSWIERNGFKNVYIHIDLDVLNPLFFHSLYFSKSNKNTNNLEGVAEGNLSFDMIKNSIDHISKKLNILGFSIAEFLPWDCLNLQEMLKNLKSYL